MRTHVTFLAAAVDGTARRPGPAEDQDGDSGATLAASLVAAFDARGDLRADPELVQEDWGWRLSVSAGPVRGSLGLGPYRVGTSSGDQAGWLCFWDPPKPRKPFLGFGKARADDHRRAVEAASVAVLRRLQEVLAASPWVSEIRWHDEARFMHGDESRWASTPLAPE